MSKKSNQKDKNGKKSIIHQEGVEFGKHKINNTEVRINRFKENNYNQLTLGEMRSGKSFSSGLNILRTCSKKEDLKVVVIDPCDTYSKVADAVGGKTLEPKFDPFKLYDKENTEMKKEFAKSFLWNSLDLQDYEKEILNKAISLAYEQKEEPGMDYIKDLVEDITDKREKITRKLNKFSRKDFVDYSVKEKEFEEKLIRFDLSNYNDYSTVTIMIMERINNLNKEIGEDILFVIEYSELMLSSEYLTPVEKIVNSDVSFNFITLSTREILSNELDQGKKIIKNCEIKLLHKNNFTNKPKEVDSVLGLNERQKNYLENAQKGYQNEYSDALIKVENGKYVPIEVYASDVEKDIISD